MPSEGHPEWRIAPPAVRRSDAGTYRESLDPFSATHRTNSTCRPPHRQHTRDRHGDSIRQLLQERVRSLQDAEVVFRHCLIARFDRHLLTRPAGDHTTVRTTTV